MGIHEAFTRDQVVNLEDGQISVSGLDVLLLIAKVTLADDADMLDDGLVRTIRRLGKAIGMDPIDVTPYQLRRNYKHKVGRLNQRPIQRERRIDENNVMLTLDHENYCLTCGLSDGDPVHKVTK